VRKNGSDTNCYVPFLGFVYIFEFLYGNEIGMMNKGLVMRK